MTSKYEYSNSYLINYILGAPSVIVWQPRERTCGNIIFTSGIPETVMNYGCFTHDIQMQVGFLPREFRLSKEGDTAETIFFCETSSVPEIRPNNSIFISKERATIEDFSQLLLLFGESFDDAEVDFVILNLGTWDISAREKQLVWNRKTNQFDYHFAQKYSKNVVTASLNNLCEMVRELPEAKKIISFDPLSLETSGFHNATIEFINKRVVKIDEGHSHLTSWKRFQRDWRKKRDKAENFPLIAERFQREGELVEEEKALLVGAALQAIRDADDPVVFEGCFFKRK